MESCEPCPKGWFSAHAGSTECTTCEFPSTSVFEGQSTCSGMSIHKGVA
eukprot:gene21213-27220_t